MVLGPVSFSKEQKIMKTVIQQLASVTGHVSIADGIATLECGTVIDLNRIEEAPEFSVLIEIDGGAIHNVRSTVPVRVVILDLDTEGGDQDRVMEVNESKVYVHDFVIDSADPDAINPDAIQSVIEQISAQRV